MTEIHLNTRQYLELEKLGLGVFLPLTGFMNEDEFHSVVNTLRLPSGAVFPLPVVLDVPADIAAACRGRAEISLIFAGREVGTLRPDSFFSPDRHAVAAKVFGTVDTAHPGVALLHRMNDVFVGGAITFRQRVSLPLSRFELTPEQTRQAFAERNWKTVVGFQTRNVPHRAHEYLQRVALEMVDGLFIQPLVGRKRVGDYTPDAIMAGYNALTTSFFPPDRVLLGTLSTFMRYAGPREALFHAIIRRNYGCTHFVVGRDHAGVGDYYAKYAAHELVEQFRDELGINVLCLHGPYYCAKCDGIVTEQTCPHDTPAYDHVTHISGTEVRRALSNGAPPQNHIVRAEVIAALSGIPLFITEDEE